MSAGLGAAFGAMLLLAVLLGLAAVLSLAAATAVVLDRRDGVPRVLVYAAVALLVGALGVAGFGVVALADEAPAAAVLFVALVFLPLAAAAGSAYRSGRQPPTAMAATAALAWGPAYVAGVAVLLALVALVAPALGLSPAQGGPTWVTWVESALAAVVVLAGAVALAARLPRRFRGSGGRPGR